MHSRLRACGAAAILIAACAVHAPLLSSAHASEPDRTRRNLNRPSNPPPSNSGRPQPDPAPRSDPEPPSPPPPQPRPSPPPAAAPSPGSGGSSDSTRRNLTRPGNAADQANRPPYIEIAPSRARAPDDRTRRSLVRQLPEHRDHDHGDHWDPWDRYNRYDPRYPRDAWAYAHPWPARWYWHSDWCDPWFHSFDDPWYDPWYAAPRVFIASPSRYTVGLPSWYGLPIGHSFAGFDFTSGWRYRSSWWTGWTIYSPLSPRLSAWRDWSCDSMDRWRDAPWRPIDPAGAWFAERWTPILDAEPGDALVPGVPDDTARYRYDEPSGAWVRVDTAPRAYTLDDQRARADAERRTALNAVYDAAPDVRSAIHATLRGDYASAVTFMRRAASQNADALLAASPAGARVQILFERDPTLAQHGAYALNVFTNPPRGQFGVSEQDARFMQAALHSVLETSAVRAGESPREAALNALDKARAAGDARISTRNLINALTTPAAGR